jgi:hypothetical protein
LPDIQADQKTAKKMETGSQSAGSPQVRITSYWASLKCKPERRPKRTPCHTYSSRE